MYFSRFGKIQYGFDKDNFKIVTDVMKRVKVKDKVLNEFSLYDKYDVQSGDTPESIAFKHLTFYSTIFLYTGYPHDGLINIDFKKMILCVAPICEGVGEV